MTEVYKIGVEIALAGNILQGLETIASRLFGIHQKVGDVEGGFKRWGTAITGVAAIMGSGIIAKGLADIVDKSADYVKVQQDMAQAGASVEQVNNAVAKSWELSAKYQNLSARDLLKLQNDARGIFGNQSVATADIGPIARAAAFLKAREGDKGSEDFDSITRELQAAIKSGEIAGKISPEEMAKHINELTAMKVAFGDSLKIAQYLTAQRNAGVALRNTSDAFRYGMFPALVQENGPNAGTMLMTAFNKVVAGVGNRSQSLENMVDIGLLKPDQLNWDKAGHAKGLKNMAGLTGSLDAALNFGDWVESTLKPKLEKQLDKEGIKDQNLRNIRESQLISSIFPDRNAAKAVTEVIQQYSKLQKDAAIIQDSYGKLSGEGAENYIANSYYGQKQAIGSQGQNLVDAAGSPLVPAATDALKNLASALNSLSEWAGKHPTEMKVIGEGLIGLSAGLAALGTVAVLTAAAAFLPHGLLAVAIVGVGSAVAALAAMNWESVRNGLNAIHDAIASFLSGLGDLLNKIPGFLGTSREGGNPHGSHGVNNPAGVGKSGMIYSPGTTRGTQVGDIYLDKQKVGAVMSREFASAATHPTQAPYFDPGLAFVEPDYAFQTG